MLALNRAGSVSAGMNTIRKSGKVLQCTWSHLFYARDAVDQLISLISASAGDRFTSFIKIGYDLTNNPPNYRMLHSSITIEPVGDDSRIHTIVDGR
jgi:hypothetical protein